MKLTKLFIADGWNPYLAGAMLGVVAVLSVALTGKFLGASTSFVRGAGAVEQLVAPERVAQSEYYQSVGIQVDWQIMLLVGLLLGAFVASRTDGSFKSEAVPPMWATRFGTSVLRRGAVAFVGGIFAMFGARMADGCPSGHGLSGMMQLSLSGFVSLACFFASGFVVARLLYARRSQ